MGRTRTRLVARPVTGALRRRGAATVVDGSKVQLPQAWCTLMLACNRMQEVPKVMITQAEYDKLRAMILERPN